MSLSDDIDNIEDSLAALHRARFQHRAWSKVQQESGVQLDKAEVALLKAIHVHKAQTCRMQDLAQALGIEAPSVTRTVKALEQRALVRRTGDEQDGRVSQIRLTQSGTNQLAKLQAASRRKLEQMFHDWSSQERQQFAKFLKRFADDITNYQSN
jgi:DNA-binding MarR family transcriptional regulator